MAELQFDCPGSTSTSSGTLTDAVISLNTLQGDLTISGAGTVLVTTAGDIITVSGVDTGLGTGGTGYTQTFSNQTLVNIEHNFGTSVHATTIVGLDNKVLQGEIVFGPNQDILAFNQSQSGIAYVVGAGGSSNIDDINTIASGSINIVGVGSVIVTTDVAGKIITISGITGAGGYEQSFTDQTIVSVTHNFDSKVHATTVVDSTEKVLQAEIVFGNDADAVSFNESQSGTVYVVASSGVGAVSIGGGGTTSGTLQDAYDLGTGVIQTVTGKPVVISGVPGEEDFRVVGSGTFTEALTVGTGTTFLSGSAITTTSGTFSESLTVSGLPVNIGLPLEHDHDSLYFRETELLSTTSGSPGAGLIGFPTVSGFAVDSINPTSPSLAGVVGFFNSAGWVTGGDVTDSTDETVLVASGIGGIRTSNDSLAELVAFGWPQTSGLAIANNTTRYIGVSYSSSADTATVLNKSSNTWDYQTEFPLGVVTNRNNILDIIATPHTVGDLPGLVNRRFEEVDGASRASGMILTESADANQNVLVSAGVLWFKLNRFTTAAIDTSGSDTFDSYHSDGGGGFTKIADETQWDELNFDDGSGLALMNPNRFNSLWFYLESDGGLSCVYGTSNVNNFLEAELEPAPSDLPPGLNNAVLLGRIIFQRSVTIAIDEDNYLRQLIS